MSTPQPDTPVPVTGDYHPDYDNHYQYHDDHYHENHCHDHHYPDDSGPTKKSPNKDQQTLGLGLKNHDLYQDLVSMWRQVILSAWPDSRAVRWWLLLKNYNSQLNHDDQDEQKCLQVAVPND